MPGQGTKIPHALWRSQKKEKKRKKETKRKNDQKSEASSENQKTMRGTGSVHMGMCIWGGGVEYDCSFQLFEGICGKVLLCVPEANAR